MFCWTIFPVYCTDYMEHVNTMCGHNVEFVLLHVLIYTDLQALNHCAVKYCMYDDVSAFRQVCKIVKKATVSFFISVCPSSCSSVCVSLRPHGTAQLSLDGFPGNLIFEYFSKIFLGNSSLIKFWQEYRVIYMKIYVHL